MKTRAFILYLALALSVVAACNVVWSRPAVSQPREPAASIILLIGDGMGPEVMGLARDYARVIEGRELWMEKTMSEGRLALVRAAPLGALVADSAAAARVGDRVDRLAGVRPRIHSPCIGSHPFEGEGDRGRYSSPACTTPFS